MLKDRQAAQTEQRTAASAIMLKTFRLVRPWRRKELLNYHKESLCRTSILSALRFNSSLTPRPENTPSKLSHGIFSNLGDPESNKPMFEQLALLTPTVIPDDPLGVVRPSDSAAKLLDHSALVVERRLEMLNVFLVSARK